MRSRTPKDAVDRFRGEQQRIVGCVSDRVLHATGYRPAPQPHILSFLPPQTPVPVRLARAGERLGFIARCDYAVLEPADVVDVFAVRIVGYWFEIQDRDGGELLAYHWHPRGASPVALPHMHLPKRITAIPLASGGAVALGEMHLPTGVVTLADVVRLLIDEFGVEPRRNDWQAILASS